MDDVSRLYTPVDGLSKVMEQDPRVNRIASILANEGLPMQEMGITGSMLLGLHSPSSDIDFVVYGPWCGRLAIYYQMQSWTDGSRSSICQCGTEFTPRGSLRSALMSSSFMKLGRATVDDRWYLLRSAFYPRLSQIKEAPKRGRNLGKRKIEATSRMRSLPSDSPAIFKLDDEEINEIFCYSHTYAGQALSGETIEASGLVEETISGCRLVVGTTREAKGEWIRSLTLLENGR